MSYQRQIYLSENGDNWWLCRDEDGRALSCTKRTGRLVDDGSGNRRFSQAG
jgi:hypothetical protein